jgi:hypothetical protein
MYRFATAGSRSQGRPGPADSGVMTKRGGRSGWGWTYLVAQVFIALWILSGAISLISGSPSGVQLAAVNLAVWVPLALFARSRDQASTRVHPR